MESEDVFPEASGKIEAPRAPEAGAVFEEEGEPPIKAGTVFDERADLKGILKTSGKERDALFKEHAEKFRYQKNGLAEMQEDFREKIKDNADISPEELSDELSSYAKKYGLTITQRLEAFSAIHRYTERRKDIETAIDPFKTEDESGWRINEKKFFSALFGSEPKGKVEVSGGPVSIYIRCYDQDDYVEAIKTSSMLDGERDEGVAKRGAFGSKAAKLSKTAIQELDNAVTLENYEFMKNEAERLYIFPQAVEKKAEEESRNNFLHEEQHAVQSILEAKEAPDSAVYLREFNVAEDEAEKAIIIKSFFREVKLLFFSANKDEILAHLSGNFTSEEFIKNLVGLKEQFKEGGFYDLRAGQGKHFIDEFIKKFSGEDKNITGNAAKEVFGERFDRVTEKGIDAAVSLLAQKYEPMRVRSMLSSVPLHMWPSEVSKLLSKST